MLVRLIVTEPDKPGSMDDHVRPARRGPFPGLWAYYMPPTTMRGILLWQDGRAVVVDSWENYALYWDADDRIAGGAEWVGEDTSWQAQVLTANGFTLAPA
jgi:hypothetical protein